MSHHRFLQLCLNTWSVTLLFIVVEKFAWLYIKLGQFDLSIEQTWHQMQAESDSLVVFAVLALLLFSRICLFKMKIFSINFLRTALCGLAIASIPYSIIFGGKTVAIICSELGYDMFAERVFAAVRDCRDARVHSTAALYTTSKNQAEERVQEKIIAVQELYGFDSAEVAQLLVERGICSRLLGDIDTSNRYFFDAITKFSRFENSRVKVAYIKAFLALNLQVQNKRTLAKSLFHDALNEASEFSDLEMADNNIPELLFCFTKNEQGKRIPDTEQLQVRADHIREIQNATGLFGFQCRS